MAATVNTAKPNQKRDVVVPLGIIGIVMMMVLPLPPMLVDAMLALSVALAIGVFLTALFIEEALEFSAFPAFVLIATLLRLSLNVATTRLILLNGADGVGAAGDMIEAFGRFVVGGNIVVGLAVFLILVVINFVVITKGAGRVAEVAARFTLDAMPGKQMAIDADLSSGMITPDQARSRRKNLEREAEFFGAMDGASKFVQGDAIAGLLITAVNLLGGIVIGLASGLDLATSASTFSILSVGDALVSQLPALLISAASGIVVTRGATGQQLGRAFAEQLLGRPRAVGLTAGILVVLAMMPAMPVVPLLGLAGLLAYAARRATKQGASSSPGSVVDAKEVIEPKRGSAEEVEGALNLELLSLELGYELVHMVDPQRGGTLLDRVAALRSELAQECGVIVPPIHVCDNLELPPNQYRVLLSGNEIASGECRNGRVMAIDPGNNAPPVEGDRTVDPTFKMPARWIHPRDREMAEALGHTVVDHATIVATHLGEMLRSHGHQLVGRQEVQHLLDVLARTSPKLVDDVVPNLLPLGDVLRVLRNLLRERISIRDMRSILESLADLSSQTKDTEQLTEMVRERLTPQITARVKSTDGSVAALTLDPRLEDLLRRSLRDIANGQGGALDPELLRSVCLAAEHAMSKFNALGVAPLVITAPDVRRYVRAIFERKIPQLTVLSFREVDAAVPLKVIDNLVLPNLPSLHQGATVNS